jgi:hypothetical protein
MTIDLLDIDQLAARDHRGNTALSRRVQSDPITALQLVSSSGTALTIGQRARAIDNVIAAIGNDAKAAELVEENVPSAVQAEALAAWGDRPSALAQVATPENIVVGLLALAKGDGESHLEDRAMAAAAIRTFAIQNHDRHDYEEILDRGVGDYTFRDLLVAAVAATTETIDTEDGEMRPRDVWVNVGLDPSEAEEHLASLDSDILEELTDTALLQARLSMAAKRDAIGLPKEAQGSRDDA